MSKVPLILHIDDSRLILSVTKEIITVDLKCNLLQTTDPDEGINLVRKHRPDIVMVDAVMEPKDGWETIQEIKKDSRFKDIPVIMLTGESKVEDIEKAYSLGVGDYLVKPPTVDKVLRKFIKILGKEIFEELGVAVPSETGAQQTPKPAAVAAPPPVQKEPVAAQRPKPTYCPDCRNYLTWLPGEYQHWYCYTCQKYPEVQPPAPTVTRKCDCGGEMAYYFTETKWYCLACKKMVP